MSWDAYVSELLKNGSMSQAALFDLSGKCAAKSANWTGDVPYSAKIDLDLDGVMVDVPVDESALLLEPWGNMPNGEYEMKSACGLRINKEKYMIISTRVDIQACYLKKPNGGGCIIQTGKLFLVGLFDTSQGANQNHASCNKDVEELAQKLRDSGF
jgi:hypothetical protein